MNPSKSQHITLFLQDIDGGGAERAIIYLANHLAFLGHTVDLVVGDAQSEYRSEIDNRVRLLDFKTRSKIRLIFCLYMYITNKKPDSIMSALDHANYMLLLVAKFAIFKGKIIFSQRSSTINTSQRISFFRKIVFWILESLLLERADIIISNSHAAANEIKNRNIYPQERVVVIPNPIDLKRIFELSKIPINYPDLMNAHTSFILGVGSVTKRKDFETLLRAFQIVRITKDIKLVILGKGYEPEEFSSLQALIIKLDLANEVYMPGFDPNPYRWMLGAKVLVSSSRNEGFPNNIAEGLALNCKIVATDCPGDTAWLLDYGRWGRLVPVGEAGSMAQKILEALDDKSLLLTTVRAADFAPEIIYQTYVDALTS
jgi:glycosyltransferase involved in cell wall biosynthesis